MPAWVFDSSIHNYRDLDTGRILSNADALDFVRQSIDAGAKATDQLAALLDVGRLRADDWYTLMREEIKGEYIRQYLLGIGGIQQMDAAKWGQVGGMIADQYRYLSGFRDEIAAGELSIEQIKARSQMYIRSAREGYERAQARVANDKGMTQEKWVLGEAEHCDDCLAYAAMGWQEIGFFPVPGAGATTCLTNCQCHREYRKRQAKRDWWDNEIELLPTKSFHDDTPGHIPFTKKEYRLRQLMLASGQFTASP